MLIIKCGYICILNGLCIINVGYDNADFLIDVGTRQGYAAVGLVDVWRQDTVKLTRNHIAIAGLPEEYLTDGIIYNGSPDMVSEILVDGKPIKANAAEVIAKYRQVAKRLF